MDKRTSCAIVPALLAASGVAMAQPIPEAEPINDFFPGQPGGIGAPFWSAEGGLVPGDIDFYDGGPAFFSPLITASTFTGPWFSSPPGVPPPEDTLIGALDPAMFVLSSDDDDNPGLNSSHHFPTPGVPVIHAVTAFPDAGFTGMHTATIPFYRFVVSTGAPIEFEPNDTIPTATPLPPEILGATAMEGTLAPGDVDYFSLFIPAGVFVTGSTFDFAPLGGPPLDTLLGVFDPGGVFLGLDDDAGPALLSAVAFTTTTSGVYTFAVSGFGDPDFDGLGHSEAGHYRLVVSVPAPGSIGLILLGAALAVSRRRTR